MRIVDSNYKIKYVKHPTEAMKIGDCVGYCDVHEKIIWVLNNEDKDATLRHEYIHAYLYEIGRESNYSDEDLVNAIDKIHVNLNKL